MFCEDKSFRLVNNVDSYNISSINVFKINITHVQIPFLLIAVGQKQSLET